MGAGGEHAPREFGIVLTCQRRKCPQLDNFLRFSIIDGPMFLEIGGKAALEWFRNVSCCLAVDIV